MTERDENGKSVSWRWLAIVAIGLIITVIGAVISDTRNSIGRAEAQIATKVDRDQYRCDMERIEKKLDKLIDFQIRDRK